MKSALVALFVLTGCEVDLCGHEAECARLSSQPFSEPVCRDTLNTQRSAATTKGCVTAFDEVSRCALALPCDAFTDGGAQVQALCPVLSTYQTCMQ